jgi:hypothetical protein
MIDSSLVYKCDHCKKVIGAVNKETEKQIKVLEDGQEWCTECFEQHGEPCEDCGKLFPDFNTYEYRENFYCRSCLLQVKNELEGEIEDMAFFIEREEN